MTALLIPANGVQLGPDARGSEAGFPRLNDEPARAGAMKPSTTRTTANDGDERDADQNRDLVGGDSAMDDEGNKHGRRRRFEVGAKVERELDGLWFPATIVAADADGTFEIEYDEDHNRELDISPDELRCVGGEGHAVDADRSRVELTTLQPC